MMKFLSVVLVAVFASPVIASDFFDAQFPVEVGNTKIMVGTYRPRAREMATVIFLHGYADTMNNHETLLSQLHDGGMRVIAFDYPSHGQSEGSIWLWDIKDVARIVHHILSSDSLTEGLLAVDRSLPVILVGWSTGGTIAIRGAQAWSDIMIPKGMNLAGVVAIAPGLPARPFVGDGYSRWGMIVKAEDLTRNPHLIKYRPKPETTVLGSGPFAVSLEATSLITKVSLAPEIPTLVLIADYEKDFFTYSKSAANWVKSGRNKPVYGFQCPGAYHGLEFEPGGVGDFTREITIEFIQRLALRGPMDVEKAYRQRNVRVCPQVHQAGD